MFNNSVAEATKKTVKAPNAADDYPGSYARSQDLL